MAEDILGYLLSGGSSNANSENSLGGFPSSVEVKIGLNTLFDQVTSSQASTGSVVYRCIYVANNASYEIFNLKTSTIQAIDSKSTIEVGINSANETQLISIFGIPTSGTFKLKYTVTVGGITVVQTTSSISWNPDQTITANNIQEEINLLTYLSDVTISVVGITGGYGYIVEFAGNDGKRAQNLLEITDFTVLGSTSANVVRISAGGPINQVAANIGFENQTPFDVEFDKEVSIGIMRSGDVYGLWIKRITPANTIGTTQEIDTSTLKSTYLNKL